jgi:PAS domain S-box-containing protein
MSIEQALEAHIRELTALYKFTDGLQRAESLDEVYELALDAIISALQCSRASILLRDHSGVMRFVASRGLSEQYQRAVDGHSPWGPEVMNAEPICVDDVEHVTYPEQLKIAILNEGIHALAFIPLQPRGRLIGKFMTYFETPRALARAEIDVAVTIARQLGFGIERKRAEQDLKVSKDRLQLALDTARLGWWRYDPRRRIVEGDTRFKEIFDVADDEIPVQYIRKLVHPVDAERFWADREAASDPANPKSSPHEYRVLRRDGEVRWVEVRWLAYFEEERRERRRASVVGTVYDITERKRRQGREHLLMQEINHRTRNMLSVVDAIANQTAARTPDGFIERFSDRIRALAVNQDLLIQNGWHGVEAEELVRAHLAPFADLIGSRIVVHGPKLRLNAASAQAVGLALHELVTNAGEYGALSTEMGRLDIRWRAEGEIVSVKWTECDGPPVSAPQRRGFGTVAIQEMAARSLEGKVEFEYAPSGVIWRLTCQAGKVLEPPERSCEEN